MKKFQNYYLKQIIWYTLGIAIAYLMMLLGNKFLYQNAQIEKFDLKGKKIVDEEKK